MGSNIFVLHKKNEKLICNFSYVSSQKYLSFQGHHFAFGPSS
jgi:hypothetical protein